MKTEELLDESRFNDIGYLLQVVHFLYRNFLPMEYDTDEELYRLWNRHDELFALWVSSVNIPKTLGLLQALLNSDITDWEKRDIQDLTEQLQTRKKTDG